jgi:hypothetical protein
MAEILHLPLNFSVKEFQGNAEATKFLKRLGFEISRISSDYELWESRERPTTRIILYASASGHYVVAKLATAPPGS